MTDLAGLVSLLKREPRGYTLAHTFPTSAHAMWLYYRLASAGVNPLSDVKCIVVPAPQMVSNMGAGNMDEFSAREPRNHRAIMKWRENFSCHIPGCLDGTPRECTRHQRRFCQAEPQHRTRRHDRDSGSQSLDRRQSAEQDEDGRNNGAKAVHQHQRGRHLSAPLARYLSGLGKTWYDANHMKFFNDGAANFP